MRNQEYVKDKYNWQDVVAVVKKLRAPDGCPWDREQTYESMKKCVTDECNEVLEAVDNKDFINLREELGDVMLQVLLYSTIAEERGEFTLDDVINGLGQKLVRRHPHVFGEQEKAIDSQDGLNRWKAIKVLEKGEKLKEYEDMYKQGRIGKELLDFQRGKMLPK